MAPFRPSVVRAARGWASDALERYYGVDSADKVGLDALGYDPAERVAYEPSRWLALPVGLSGWAVGEGDVLVDIGAGKGRVVVQAARHYRFRRVIGVELSATLAEQARANVERNRGRLRCPNVELVTSDALAWEPPGDLTIAYLFHPFPGEVFSELVARLAAFVTARDRPLRIVYVNPSEHDRLLACGQVVELGSPARWLSRLAGLSSGALRRYELRPGSRHYTGGSRIDRR